jgi:DNA-binding LacI/PurR family transcriptional regulator
MLDMKAPPTAFLAANFLILTGILRALKERRLHCPEQIEVMSWDDSDWLDVFEPVISSVVVSSYAMGETAAGLLVKRMRQPARKYKTIVIPPKLRIRQAERRTP